jgi:hypothetical protein
VVVKTRETEGWKQINNVDFRDLYSSTDQMKQHEMYGTFSDHGEDEKCTQNFGWKI